MLNYDPSDYRNFVYGVISANALQKAGQHAFKLWDESLILFWNKGDVRCYKNHCRHYGLPLDQGRLRGSEIECGFHGWRYRLSDGDLVKAPLARRQPKCGLFSYKAFYKGGIVFVYPGDLDHFEAASNLIFERVLENPASIWTVYEVPFYLAMNSSMDYPHHMYHSFFYQIYGWYRSLFRRKNPLGTTYTPVILEETDRFFKFRISETDVEITVHPFCTEYNDVVSKNRWQMFIMPITESSCRYLINIQSESSNILYRGFTYMLFYTFIKHLAMPEDQKWLKSSHNFWRQKQHVLCDQDFGLTNYLRKFFIKPSSVEKKK